MELAARAATLVLVARRVERLEELRAQLAARHQGLTVIVAPGDLSDEADLERLVAAVAAQVGVVDVLVNNAGVGDAALFDQADWSRTSLRASTPAPSASQAGDRAESTTEYGPAPGQAAP